jgi:integrase
MIIYLPAWQRSSVVEQGTHKPLVSGPNPLAATFFSLNLPSKANKLGNIVKQNSKLSSKSTADYLSLFLQSRKVIQVSPTTIIFYQNKLNRFFKDVNPDLASEQDIERFLLQFDNAGNRHCYFRALKTFYRWRLSVYGLANPMEKMRAPRLGKLNLPSLTKEQVSVLLDKAHDLRDKTIIALFTESGLRLSELTNIKLNDIDWDNNSVTVIGKGNKEGLAPFGKLSEKYLKEWLTQHKPDGNIWGVNMWGIESMLRRLEEETGLPCNPHTFRRTFACLLRKAGLDSLTIKDLGRWESLEMVQRYTRSITFQDSLKLYKAPLD